MKITIASSYFDPIDLNRTCPMDTDLLKSVNVVAAIELTEGLIYLFEHPDEDHPRTGFYHMIQHDSPWLIKGLQT